MIDGIAPGWLWLIGGLLLLMAELIAPGVFLLFIGAAAMITGVFVLLFGLGLAPALALFALYTAVAVLIGRKVYANQAVNSPDPLLNDRGARLIGRVVTATSPIDASHGRVRVGDSEWSARGGPAAAGDQVRITGVDGNCLRVEIERSLPPA
ncbi:NfeD family protein [Sphingomonas sp. KRR8]|uniref:NfeD family protein n=1 Tax=Sphingomonas sp. KRR8 TaxID=2942996 RepID=UPI002022600F|nr:NfeD family protein [Sphingomonas sp. KRR8]URD62147.1 NfeD family protein [Sphingomonas sp. KRR8]